MIKNNSLRKPKALWTENDEVDDSVIVHEMQSDGEEAKWVANNIKEMREQGYELSDFAVLYRTNAQSRNFEEALRHLGLPYKTVGSIAFYQRAEVKDILAYASLINNPKDDLSFLRIINLPKRGLGPVAVDKLREFADFKGWSLYETVCRIDEVPTLSTAQRNRFMEFREIMAKLEETASHATLAETIETIYDVSGYGNMLAQSSDKLKAKTKVENIGELVTAASEVDDNTPNPTLSDFLENAALASATDEEAEDGQVSLMTLHSAKGLEFPIVYLTGMEENIFPSVRSKDKAEQEEEERRLCYVGITRAREKLHITHADSRRVFGEYRHNKASKFIGELPSGITYYSQDETGEFYLGPKKPKERHEWRTIFEQGTVKDTYDCDLKAGDLVHHDTYGNGSVMQIMDKYVKVAFKDIGIKKLGPQYLKKYE